MTGTNDLDTRSGTVRIQGNGTNWMWRNLVAHGIFGFMASTMTEYRARRAEMLAYLGGCCVICETTIQLQFDHIDRETKAFDVSANWGISWDRLVIELDKCQLLCEIHHREKSLRCGDLTEWQHGTRSGYRYCKCVACRASQAEYMREYRKTHPRKKLDVAQLG